MSRVFLIGFMGSGKSTVGRMVADRLGMPFVDLDQEVSRRAGASIAEIFARSGEEGFRALEHETLRAVAEGPDAVVACGGGVVLRDENRQLLKRSGTVVYLAVSAEEALARIGDVSGRPLLAGDARAIAPRILAARLALYRATADITVDTMARTPQEVVEEVVLQLAGRARRVVRVEVDPPYDVVLGMGVADEVPDVVAPLASSGTVAVISDENVADLHGQGVLDALVRRGLRAFLVRVPPGEGAKSWNGAGELLERFAALGLDRGSVVVAVGGGVVGDLAGFVASVYMRGIPVVQVPTTLLAQVDSSIGGKTGVDLAAGKNLAGTFWQPHAVVSDQAVLHTLPDAEWANGWAEVVKTALLAGGALWDLASTSAEHLAARDDRAVGTAVEGCVRFKACVVAADQGESLGFRECLNLGHTLGHAIEREAGYGTVPHGIAVAEGLRFASRISVTLAGADAGLPDEVGRILDELGVPRAPLGSMSADALVDAMRADKKARGGAIRLVLLRAPGDWTVAPVPEDRLRAEVQRFLAEGGDAR
ncbi:MAG: 3-dehydroquinate synthase [Coriobacteriia bacterium]|nr:3-dehydroquinate synthase [Coriobacteriia bacterium]